MNCVSNVHTLTGFFFNIFVVVNTGSCPTPNSYCLSAHHKTNSNATNTGSSTTASQKTTATNQKNAHSNQIDNMTVSRPPPWRRHSIALRPPMNISTLVDKAFTPEAENRVPPLPQQQHLPDGVHDRKNTKKRPNFKEDPTGYLGDLFG